MSDNIEIDGVPFDALSYEQVLEGIDFLIRRGGHAFITTPNPEMVLNAKADPQFKNVLKKADISIPDGIGILWAAHYLSKPKASNLVVERMKWLGSLFGVLFWPSSIKTVIKERITGSDLFEEVVAQSEVTGWRIFLLGAEPGVAESATEALMAEYPKANIVGYYAGTPAEHDTSINIEKINEAKPDILFVAYGSPAQERWIYANFEEMDTVRVAIGVGGAFDFAAGKVLRAPRWMQMFGLEWFWRLGQEPKRFKRIYKATVRFSNFIYRLKIEK